MGGGFLVSPPPGGDLGGDVWVSQDQLHVVDNLEVPTADPRYLQDLARYRHWGSSVLIVDV